MNKIDGRLRGEVAAFVKAGYADVLATVRSLELLPDLVAEGPDHFSIQASGIGVPTIILTDFWDPLPTNRSEQVGWTLSVLDGEVLSQSERPTAEGVRRLIEPALRELKSHSSAA
jgi:hypothetical protein